MADDTASPDLSQLDDIGPGSSALARNLSIFTAVVVTVSGAAQGWSSLQINKALEEGRRTQAFSQQILNQMDNLTGADATKGRVALVGLYVIAANPRDKLHIANIALQSGKTELQDTAAVLLGQDCQDAADSVQCQEAKQLLAQSVDRAVQSRARQEQGWQPAVVPFTPLNQTMELLTAGRLQRQVLSGWIYLGKSNRDGLLQADRTTSAERKPELPGTVSTTTAVYLRTQGSAQSGQCLGILPKGQRLRIWALRSSPLSGQAPGTQAVWARVSSV
jgi:hypothetical protein